MSDFETAKELAQHIANIAPHGAVVSYKNNQVTVRFPFKAETHEAPTVVRDDGEPVKAAQAETGADESAASFRPQAPSLNGLSNRLDAQRAMLKSFFQMIKDERAERRKIVTELLANIDATDEAVDEGLDAVHDRLDKGVERFGRIDEWIQDVSDGLQKQIDQTNARLDHLASERSEDSLARLAERVEDLEKANIAFALPPGTTFNIPMPHYPDVDTTPQRRKIVSWWHYADELEAELCKAKDQMNVQAQQMTKMSAELARLEATLRTKR